MLNQVTVLQPRQLPEFDEDMLESLARDLGQQVAENLLCRALEDMALRLSDIRLAYAEGRARDLHKAVRSLIPMAEQVALPKVAHVARDVLECIDRGEGVALSATLCRLIRSGESAVACNELGSDLSL